MNTLLPLLWSCRRLRCTICCCCFPLYYDVQIAAVAVVSKWSLVRTSTNFCHCFGLEVVAQCYKVRFVTVTLLAKWCPNARIYGVLLLLCSRKYAHVLCCTTCCRCFDLEVVPECWDVRFVAVALVSKWCPSARMHDLLPLFWFEHNLSVPSPLNPLPSCTFRVRVPGRTFYHPYHQIYKRSVAGPYGDIYIFDYFYCLFLARWNFPNYIIQD